MNFKFNIFFRGGNPKIPFFNNVKIREEKKKSRAIKKN